MRVGARAIVVPVLAAILAAPLGTSGSLSMDDPRGDATLAGAPLPLDSPLDILGLNATETVTDVQLALRVASLPTSGPATTWQVSLALDDEHWRLEIQFDGSSTNRPASASLRWLDSGGLTISTRSLQDPAVDWGQNTVTASVPREYLMKKSGVQPSAGDTIFIGPARSAPSVDSIEAGESDQIPDSGEGRPLVFDLNGFNIDDVLVAVEPLGRFSNGEAAIHPYRIQVQNVGVVARDVEFGVRPAAGTDAVISQLHAHLSAGENDTLQAWILMPFQHQHGTNVDATLSVSVGPHAESIPLRVRFADIPQPTGHHPDIWLHAFPSTEQEVNVAGQQTAFWSTLEGDDRSSGEPIAPNRAGGVVSNAASVITWEFRYSPDLVLDIDTRGRIPGHLMASIQTDIPLLDAELGVEVQLRDEAGSVAQTGATETIVQLPRIPLGNLAPGDIIDIEEVLTTVAPPRLIAAKPGYNLWVVIDLYNEPGPLLGPAAPPPAVWIQPGATIRLPLRDVTDADPGPPTGVFTEVVRPTLAPGVRTVIQVNVTTAVEQRIEVVGPMDDWIVDAPAVIAAGTRVLEFVVQPPDHVAPGVAFVWGIVAREEDGSASFLPVTGLLAPAAPSLVQGAASPVPSALGERDTPLGLAPLFGLVLVALASRRRTAR